MTVEVTINGVRDAVVQALEAAFPAIPVSAEGAEQLDPPYCRVILRDPTHTQELGRRYRRVHPFEVRYFGDADDEDRYEMAEKLTDALRWITVGGRACPGQGMKAEMADEALVFSVGYQLLVWAAGPDEPAMEQLEQEVDVT